MRNFPDTLMFALLPGGRSAQRVSGTRGTTPRPGTSHHELLQLGGSNCGTARWRAAAADSQCKRHNLEPKPEQALVEAYGELDPIHAMRISVAFPTSNGKPTNVHRRWRMQRCNFAALRASDSHERQSREALAEVTACYRATLIGHPASPSLVHNEASSFRLNVWNVISKSRSRVVSSSEGSLALESTTHCGFATCPLTPLRRGR